PTPAGILPESAAWEVEIGGPCRRRPNLPIGTKRRRPIAGEGTLALLRSQGEARASSRERISPMKTFLVMAGAASILLTTAALAPTEASSNHARGAGERDTVMTDNEELMCRGAGSRASPPWAPPADLVRSIAHLRAEGDVRCTPSMINGL